MKDHRYETKVRCSRDKWLKLWMQIQIAFNPKEIFYERLIESVYFDDANLTSIKDNIAGLANRKKFRVRRYIHERIETNDNVFFEIKSKSNKLGHKVKIPILGLADVFGSRTIFEIQQEIFRNHSNELFSQNVPLDLAPVALIRYSRRYFKSDEVTITVDNGLQIARAQLARTPKEHNFFALNDVIAEFKFTPESRNSFLGKISHTNITLTRCSKYALAHAYLSGIKYF